MYRYREMSGGTSTSIARFKKHIHKIGKLRCIKGYRFHGRYRHTERVIFCGDKGSCRFLGFMWGYSGTGPRGLIEVLMHLGLSKEYAEFVAQSPRLENVGTDWKVTFSDLYAPRLIRSIERIKVKGL